MATVARLLLGLLIAAGPVMADATPSELTLRINGLDRARSTLAVEFKNPGQHPIRIWRESNSWGSGHWRILVLRNGVLVNTLVQRMGSFTRNVPRFDSVEGGASLKRSLDLSEFTSAQTSKAAEMTLGDVLIVIYDCPRLDVWPEAKLTVEIEKMRVWHGMVAASKFVD